MLPVKRTRRPVILVINYIVYATMAGWVACWWFVTNYGGTMPPGGSLDDFIADTWIMLTTGFAAPIIATMITSWFMNRRKRSADR